MNPLLQSLKQDGHLLLNEYISLDYKRNVRQATNHAYEKLSEKLGGKNPHFSQMHTREEIQEAICRLRRMIQKRKSKIEFEARDKIQVASNVMELQRNIKPHVIHQ